MTDEWGKPVDPQKVEDAFRKQPGQGARLRARRDFNRRDTEKSRNVEAEHAAIVHAVLKRDADAAVAALSEHFLTTMHLVELADAGIAAGSNTA